MAQWKIHVRDENLVNQGKLETYQRSTWRLRLNEAGSHLTEGINADDEIAQYLWATDTGGGTQGLMLLHNEADIVASGPVKQTRPTEDADSFEDTAHNVVARLDVAGVDDTALLAERLIYPDFTGPPFGATYYEIGGNAQSVMHTLVSANAGPAANPYGRQIRGLTIGPNSGLGATVAGSWRFENLLAELQKLALPSNLRFEVRQSIDGTRAFIVYGTSDRRQQVIFRVGSTGGGVLESIESAETAPITNHVTRLGKGEGTDRQVDQDQDLASIAKWGRIETVIDGRQSDDPTQVATDIDAALSKGAGFESFQVTVASSDPTSLQYYDDYGLGDRVSWRTWDGRRGEGYVVELEIVLDGTGGAIITPTIASSRVAPASRDQLRAIGQRVGRLETGIELANTTGVAVLWTGTVGTIPVHYQLMDGTGGTHDSRNKFLLGAGGLKNPGDTGGTALNGSAQVIKDISHVHSMSHTHNIDHNHPAKTTSAPSNTATINTVGAGNAAAGDHTHTVDLDALGTVQSGDTSNPNTSSGGSSTLDVTPPYLAEALIVRTS